MDNAPQTLFDIIHHILTRHPELTEPTEALAANLLGKGYGTATIEQEVHCAMALLGGTPRLAIDIGGNVGNYCAELLRHNPNAEIHVFEPSVANLPGLRERFADKPGVHILPYAVSDKDAVATLYADVPGSGLASLALRDLRHRGIAFDRREEVRTVRFEGYWSAVLGRRPLDLVKIDIEGYELAALHGFGEAIQATRAIQFEFGGCNIDTRTFFKDFWDFFASAGFDIYRVAPRGPLRIGRYQEIDEFFSTTNFIAIRQLAVERR